SARQLEQRVFVVWGRVERLLVAPELLAHRRIFQLGRRDHLVRARGRRLAGERGLGERIAGQLLLQPIERGGDQRLLEPVVDRRRREQRQLHRRQVRV